jgi:AraC-like DNA-binding protein
MKRINNMVITEITNILTVPSEKGRYFEMKNRGSYAISFCTQGRITYKHKGKTYVSDKNCAVLIPKGQSYSLYGNETGFFPLINFNCKEDLIDTFLVIPLRNAESYIKDLEHMKNLSLFEKSNAKIMSIFYDILSRLSSEEIEGNNILSPAIKYLEENYASCELNNSALAELCHISEVYFRKIFAQQMGITPKQYILDIRIGRAKQLLGSLNISVSQIAEQCGFSSVYHFCRAFRKMTGFTPTEYRKEIQKIGV